MYDNLQYHQENKGQGMNCGVKECPFCGSDKENAKELWDNRVDVCSFRTKTRRTNMTVFKIVKDYLKKNKLDGLVNYELSCACSLDDLEPCGHMTSDCMPGKFNELRGYGDVFIDPVHVDSE